jgi:phosphopantothenoylcysteine decarboxylase/phosphopantothenate--cysteine ligase
MSAHVVVGVAGGIAAYKSCALVRLLTEAGHDVTVVPTAAALRFVGAATWEALSGRAVHTELWDGVADVPHVRIGRSADLVVVAPATADLMARAAHGLADDLLTNVLLTATCPVLMAPAMHTEMWLHPATVANAQTLRSRGVRLVGPVDGRLTGADSGPGRLAEPEQIAVAVTAELARPLCRDLVGRHVVITAGGTREAVDPVRFLGNRSSGKQGAALAAAAVSRGARVTLIHGAIDAPTPVGVDVFACTTAAQMHDLVVAHATDADVLVMAAAVADFRPTEAADHKIKKSGADLSITAEPTVDILRDAVERRGPARSPVIVGFAAETGDADGDVLTHARRKLATKGCDLLVVNDVRGDRAFGAEDNEVVLLSATDHREIPRADKIRIAHAVWDRVGDFLADRG